MHKRFQNYQEHLYKLQAMYPNIFKGELMCSFRRNKIWVIILFQWNWSRIHLWETGDTS